MLKAVAGLLPLALGLAGVGVAIWFLLARDMALGRWLLGAFLVAHGLVHVLFVVPRPAGAATTGAAEWPFDMTRSWLVTVARMDPSAVRLVGVALIFAVVLGFLLAGLATVGILVPPGQWQVLVLASTAASVVLLAFFPSPQLVLGAAIDAVLLWMILASVWVPTAAV